MASGPYKNNSGWYFITWSNQGRQTKEALKTKSLPEARRRKAKLEADHFNGDHDPFQKKWHERPENGLSLPEIAEEYISLKLSQKGRKGWKSRRTQEVHSSVIRSFAAFPLTEEGVRRFLHRKEIKTDTARQSYKMKLDPFLRWCEKMGYVKKAPIIEIDIPQRQVREYVNDAALRKVFSRLDEICRDRKFSIDTSWYGDFCRVAVGTGLRPGELLQLKSDDVTDSDIYVGKSFRVKTNAARIVPLDDPIAEVIHEYRNGESLFSRSTTRWLNRDLKKACREVGVKELTVKEFRHLYAIRYLIRHEGDFALLKLSRNMGHASLSTTEIYLSYIPSDRKL